MKSIRTHRWTATLAALAVCLAVVGPTAVRAADPAKPKAAAPDQQKLMKYEEAEQLVKTHLATFDELDYVVFTQQQWQRLHESHSKDVLVHWPDGHFTKGIEKHIEDLKAMFVYAPDTRIKVHTVKLGQGEWTAVIGVMEGTFTQPMPGANGNTIAPTGKPYKINMCTVGHWKDGVMDEEYLFWDNLTFMQQIGLAK
jgi:hypothetical protein